MNREEDKNDVNVFYHITFRSRLDSILQLGLLPAIELKKMGFEQPYPSDGRYVHLFNRERMGKNIERLKAQPDSTWLLDKEVLEVRLSPGFPVEREYDQAMISLRLAGDELIWFLQGRGQSTDDPVEGARDYVRQYFAKTYGMDYQGEFIVEAVRDFVDARITDGQWAQNDGSYRTKDPISPECLRVATETWQ